MSKKKVTSYMIKLHINHCVTENREISRLKKEHYDF